MITNGAGNHSLWAQRFLPHHGVGSLLAPRNGAMGFGVPAAVAASLVHPGRQVVSIAGDGCFLMNAQELATAVAYGATPLILVVDNAKYGTIRMYQELHHPGRVSGTALVNPDFGGFRALVRRPRRTDLRDGRRPGRAGPAGQSDVEVARSRALRSDRVRCRRRRRP